MKTVELRKTIGREILELAKHASHTGEPIMRYMEYEFPGEGFEFVVDQFMVGNKYLVAPVLRQGQTTKLVKFPAGKWKGDDGSIVLGPCEKEIPALLSRIPWFVRDDYRDGTTQGRG
jgi:alpha-glucosidase (family GH31 glycosyl hydrolase)